MADSRNDPGDNSDADISKRLNLPKAGPNLSTISWSFSEEGIILAGAVMRPAGGDKTITLTATLSLGGITETKTFEFKVKASSSEEEESFGGRCKLIYGQVFYLDSHNDIRDLLCRFLLQDPTAAR